MAGAFGQNAAMDQEPLKPGSLKEVRRLCLDGRDALANALSKPERSAETTIELGDMAMDFSRQPLDAKGLGALADLARERRIPEWRDAMMAGEVINASEGRPVRHTALRDPEEEAARANVDAMAARIEELLAAGVEDIVSIGIGGSDLGPAMAVQALAPFHQGPEVHFVGNIDPSHMADCLEGLQPATTAFIVISKSFRTEETLANSALARHWLEAAGMDPAERMVAVTSNPEAAAGQGFGAGRILAMDEAVGGRFSLWSAVGLGIMAAVGREGFIDLLAGAEAMDRHFAEAPLEANMPVVCGLLRLLNHAVLGRPAQAVIPYDQRLARLPAWLQQLEMESNGKSSGPGGGPVEIATSPVIFGEPGSCSQHSFFQMLHQGPMVVPVDFLAPRRPINSMGEETPLVRDQHRALVVNMLAQADALALGQPENGFPGGRPSTVVTWDQTTPHALGRLLAMYEHATAVHGWLLGLNSFDQPGVELGKRLAGDYRKWIDGDDAVAPTPSSQSLLTRYRDSG